MSNEVSAKLEELPRLRTAKLRALWQELFEKPVHPKLRREMMIPILAYRIQEKAYGGLKPSTRKRLAQTGPRARTRSESPTSGTAKIKTGTKLLRQWRGETHDVMVARRRIRLSQQTLQEPVRDRTADYRHSLVRTFVLRAEAAKESEVRSMKPIAAARVRCAIYTRKSSEEGLEQSFNSLQAQREACEAYIASQRHEGWQALSKQYDDGGFSGGNMNRPALKQLLEDIAAGLIDTIVVYKVDRLTRSLTDFAKMVEVFDQKGVSFVSVTQQFNTTTSMGRLTLNVLLSFAQFEREVTGERIRDKIAASKKKGMWMGGLLPLGYDLKDRKLVVNPKEAKIVQEIFVQYLRLRSVAELKRYLDQKRIRTKARTSANGRTFGGEPYARGGLYKLLRNEVYIGKIAHRGQSYDGQQPAIVEPETWNNVSTLLANNNDGKRTRGRRASSSPLIGLLFDEQGNRYTPTHSVKSGRRYRYYTSQAVIRKQRKPSHLDRIPAQELEQLIYSRIHSLLSSPEELSSAFMELALSGSQFQRIVEGAQQLTATWAKQSSQHSAELITDAVTRVVVKDSAIQIELGTERLAARLNGDASESSTANDPPRGSASHVFRLACPLQLSHRRGELRLVLPNTTLAAEHYSVVRAIARSLQWKERIIAGEIYCKEQLAAEANMNASYVGRILRLGSLSPDIVDSAIRHHSVFEYSLTRRFAELPFDWNKQRDALRLLERDGGPETPAGFDPVTSTV